MTYGATPPAITPGYSGFITGDSASSLTTEADVHDARQRAPSAVSESPYVSTCSGAVDPNYTIVYVNGSVTVEPGAAHGSPRGARR